VEETYSIHLEHSITVQAPTETLYGLVADVTRMGEFSPECYRAEWTRGAPGEVGSQFVGHNRVGQSEWSMLCEVVRAEPGRCFSWTVLTEAVDRETSVWTFDFMPAGDRTVVTERFSMKQPPTGLQERLDQRSSEQQRHTIDVRRARHDNGMRATLASLRREAELRTAAAQ
jgi:ribosome-associated toxin RatA of RatAB toxin-antitoxin module